MWCALQAGVVGLRSDSTARQNVDKVLHCATTRPCSAVWASRHGVDATQTRAP